MGFEPSTLELHLDACLVSKVVEVLDFMSALKVGRFMPVVVDKMTHPFY